MIENLTHRNQVLDQVGFKKPASPFSFQTKCEIVALTVVGVAGTVLASLGALCFFYPIGSVGYITLISAGGAMLLTTAIGLCYLKYATDRQNEFNRLNALHAPEITQQIAVENDLFEKLAQKVIVKGQNISEALQKIPKEFFQEKSQERAKRCFSSAMSIFSRVLLESGQIAFPAVVDFPKAGKLDNPEKLEGKLMDDVFHVSPSAGIEKEILSSARDTEHVHIYQIASQNNAAEAANLYTPAVGEAMKKSEKDRTQGPLAQRTNPLAFELVTALLTHLGFNMLDEVAPSAGKTYEQGARNEHGYLCPNDQTIRTITNEYKENFSQAEFVCYSSYQESWGAGQPVFILLQAAPAIFYSAGLTRSSNQLQKYAALANYLALFRHGVTVAKRLKEEGDNRSVILHAAAVGGGVYGNKTANIEWGFKQAALAVQSEMKAVGVRVQLEAFARKAKTHVPVMQTIAGNLDITFKNRIGDLDLESLSDGENKKN